MLKKAQDFLLRHPWPREILWQIAAPLSLLLIVFLFFPTREQFQFTVDEGFHLMWAMLLDKGYALYSEIWIDQPPLLTYILATSFRFLGYKVGVARYIILLFSGMLIWTAFQYLRTLWGKQYAIAGVLLIIMLPNYLILSITIRQTIPNLAFAVLALFLLTKWHQAHNYAWLIGSAVALAASVLTKLYTGFLAPIFAIGIWVGAQGQLQNKKLWYQALFPVLLWGVIFCAVLAVCGIVFIGVGNLDHLVAVHLVKNNTAEKLSDFTIAEHMKRSYSFLYLALVGSVALLRKKQWLALYPIAWIIAAYVMLSFYYPVWSHYKPLIDVPLALLGAYAVVTAFQFLKQVIMRFRPYFSSSPQQLIQLAALVGLIALFFRLPKGLGVLEAKPSLSGSGLNMNTNDVKFFELMVDYASQTEWVVTDMPMYAFRARLPVPPNLALISQSRIDTGFITDQEIIETIQEYNPEQVLIGHFSFPQVEDYLSENYRLLHSYEGVQFYLRNDIEIIKTAP